MRNDTESALIIVKGSRSRKLDFPNIYVTFSVNFTNIKGLFACQCYWFDISFVILINEGDFVRLAPTCFSPLLFMFLRILSLTKYDKTRTPLQRHSALALLGVRPRNEETINNSARNRIYSLNVFYLFLNWFSMLVSMEKRLRPQAIRMYKYTKIPEKLHHCQRSKIYFHGTYIISIIAENKSHPHHVQKPFAYNESLQHPTIPVLLIKISFFGPLSSVHLFRSNRRFQVIKFADWHISEKL